ncbi:estradiol 17-beta-dehydrogenase 11 [Coccinella septempunctata]|uniref:estradiol 17-beta-dehydrogenase 11 n=1 Tax=Coccinella septempunctata TaxID=41139 RepID=UPI001D06F797|nr:estradiol 17-beta-dehydrogenase 11 [Coccinella septempunctata]XP_044759328.1 estradiol 17-beta-dehydrogenase 11 [Coccinella septempunctata]XP_044759329.1 estradiol 17-beta-dehydrogenase 11 [Coccinella septempunctata]XP_044759330.1 estradiol 17-beta-dehydrogenase 11 [Coccinella septempunctata]XP_044759331.1 estradiol 17-beta-dehydrogenase 11 [Coccinella septempunctata]XP_044759332.1 estradiol 17-beta-dehydrogenase 11 [Coccinella septempunctata]
MVSKSDYNLLQSIVDVVGFIVIALGIIAQSIVRACLPKSYRKFKNLNGQNVLITGGGGGLGRLLALRMANQGAKIIVWDVNQEGIEETLKQVKAQGGTIHGLKCDLSKNEDVYRVAKLTKEEFGDIDILINNAGVLSGKFLLDTPDRLIQLTFDVNILAHFWTVKAFLPAMISRNKGHIITIASMAGHVGVSKLVDYCASKYAAVGFDESLRMELEDQGVTGVKTTAVCPYFIQSTGMFGNVHSRFLSTLKLSDVADRIVEAIQREEEQVMIPSVLRLTILLKLVMPWPVVSMFMRGLVPDAAPEEPTNKLNNNMVKPTSKEAVNVKND